jgi:hypothetical protein
MPTQILHACNMFEPRCYGSRRKSLRWLVERCCLFPETGTATFEYDQTFLVGFRCVMRRLGLYQVTKVLLLRNSKIPFGDWVASQFLDLYLNFKPV